MENEHKYMRLENAQQVLKELKTIEKSMGDLRPVLRVIRRYLLNLIDENFETQGQSSGEKWQEWSDSWKEYRKKINKQGNSILEFNGDLRRSMLSQIKKDSLTIGSPLVYSAVHQFGYDEKNIPARPFFRFTDENIMDLQAEIHYFYLSKIKYAKPV